ncbi:hypothetical protein MJH12_00295, partial [bacterium]|nr:hypothetical protein [bacterium]
MTIDQGTTSPDLKVKSYYHRRSFGSNHWHYRISDRGDLITKNISEWVDLHNDLGDIRIYTYDDLKDESTEYFEVKLQTGELYEVGTKNSHIVYLEDNDGVKEPIFRNDEPTRHEISTITSQSFPNIEIISHNDKNFIKVVDWSTDSSYIRVYDLSFKELLAIPLKGLNSGSSQLSFDVDKNIAILSYSSTSIGQNYKFNTKIHLHQFSFQNSQLGNELKYSEFDNWPKICDPNNSLNCTDNDNNISMKTDEGMVYVVWGPVNFSNNLSYALPLILDSDLIPQTRNIIDIDTGRSISNQNQFNYYGLPQQILLRDGILNNAYKKILTFNPYTNKIAAVNQEIVGENHVDQCDQNLPSLPCIHLVSSQESGIDFAGINQRNSIITVDDTQLVYAVRNVNITDHFFIMKSTDSHYDQAVKILDFTNTRDIRIKRKGHKLYYMKWSNDQSIYFGHVDLDDSNSITEYDISMHPQSIPGSTLDFDVDNYGVSIAYFNDQTKKVIYERVEFFENLAPEIQNTLSIQMENVEIGETVKLLNVHDVRLPDGSLVNLSFQWQMQNVFDNEWRDIY